MDAALDLVERLMQSEATRRITPKEALAHPFLQDPDEPDDDEFVPHQFGEGVCAELHFYDETTDEPCVKVRRKKVRGNREEDMEIRQLLPGEGIAIGNMPCEFHEEELGYKFS